LTPALKLDVPAEAVIISAPSAKVTSAAKLAAPSTSTASRLVVPSTSMSPEMSKLAKTEVPVPVTVPPTPKLPATVTFVVPVGISITSASASFLIVTSLVEP